MSRKRKQTLRIVAVLAAILLAGGAVLLAIHRWDTQPDAPISTDDDPQASESLTYYQGGWYAPRKVETLLLIGVDKYADDIKTNSYNNDQQADFLLLVVYDAESETCSALPLNRDTMTEITATGVNGQEAGTFTGQLALAHTYGSGRGDSARNTVRAVSHLLYGAEIDHYIVFTMDAIAVINDAVGGVTVTVEDDFSGVTDMLPMGQTVTLSGETAVQFVRSRGSMKDDSSNINRMHRQSVYLEGLYRKLRACAEESDSFVAKTLLELSAYTLSDCTVNQLQSLYDKAGSCPLTILPAPEGNAVQGEAFMEFYVDEAKLQQTAVDLFFRLQKTEK